MGASPPLCENMCVRSFGYIVGASPPLCVRSIANTCMLPIGGKHNTCGLSTTLSLVFYVRQVTVQLDLHYDWKNIFQVIFPNMRHKYNVTRKDAFNVTDLLASIFPLHTNFSW